MEHSVIHDRKAVNGNRTIFRQWHRKFTTTLGQVDGGYEDNIYRTAREMNFGKGMDKIMVMLGSDPGPAVRAASRDL